MSNQKKGFVFYSDWEEFLQLLDSKEDIADVIMAVLAYAARGEQPELKGSARIVFTMFRRIIDNDSEKYAQTCRRRSESGKQGGRPKKEEDGGNADCEAPQKAPSAGEAHKEKAGKTTSPQNKNTSYDLDGYEQFALNFDLSKQLEKRLEKNGEKLRSGKDPPKTGS